ncbi:MAG: OmpA family protein [bacterium]|nr:OmpA family protein [bacterium]
MSKIFKIILAVLGLLMLWALTIYFRRASIEQDLTDRAKLALAQPEFSQVSVTFEGRDGTLAGEVSSQQLADEAESLAQKLWGIRTINNQLIVPTEKSQTFATLQGYFQSGKFILDGIVPDEGTGQQLIQKATAVLGEEKVLDKLSIKPDVQLPERFHDAIAVFWGLKGIDEAGFSIGAGNFALKGKVPTEEIKNRLGAEVTKSLTPLQIQNELQVSSTPVAKPTSDELQKFFDSNVIEFELASSLLSSQSRKILDRAYKLLKQSPQASLEIAGHTDNSGPREYNMRLSKSRAIAVRLYLLEKEIAPERLSIAAYGETKPIANNDTEEGRQRNRRVEMRLQ